MRTRADSVLQWRTSRASAFALACLLATVASCGVGVSREPLRGRQDGQWMDAASPPVSDGRDAKDDGKVVDTQPDLVIGGGTGGAPAGGSGGINAGSGGAAGAGAGGAAVPGSGDDAATTDATATSDGGAVDAASEKSAPVDASGTEVTTTSGPTCLPGSHRCGDACVANSSVDTCGAGCTPCPKPANATATCDGTSCGFVCAMGANRCGTTCVQPDDVTACGSQCVNCPIDENGTRACVNGSCQLTCGTGFHLCGQRCVSNSSAASCGTSCTPCFAPSGATAVCRQERCAITCPNGQTECSGACIATGTPCGGTCPARSHLCGDSCASDSSVASCGPTACAPCPVPDGATSATCDGLQCGVVCATDRHRCDNACPPADRSVACVGKTAASQPRTFVRGDGQQAIVFVTGAGHIMELANAPAGPVVTDATESAHAVPCASEVSGYRRSDDLSALVYRGTDKHIHELTKAPASSEPWVDTDLTAATASGVVPDGDPFGYVQADRNTNAVIFRKEGHIHELTRIAGVWMFRDLTVAAIAYLSPPVVGNPIGLARTDDNNAAIYRDSAGRIREISYFTTAGIFDHDLMSEAQTVAVPALDDPWAYVSSKSASGDGTNSVLYVGTDNRVHEYLVTFPLSGRGWTYSTLPSSNAIGRPSAQWGSDGKRVVIYRTSQGGTPSLSGITSGTTWSTLTLPAPGFPGGATAGDPFVGLAGGSSVVALYRSQDNQFVEYRLSTAGTWKIVTY